MLAAVLMPHKEKEMEKSKNFKGMSLIVALLIVCVVSSCGGGAALNGTWQPIDLGLWGGMEGLGEAPPYVLQNENWEFSYRQKGTYKVSGSNVTFTTTHWGAINNTTGEREWEPENGVDPFTVEIKNNSFVRSGVTYTKQ